MSLDKCTCRVPNHRPRKLPSSVDGTELLDLAFDTQKATAPIPCRVTSDPRSHFHLLSLLFFHNFTNSTQLCWPGSYAGLSAPAAFPIALALKTTTYSTIDHSDKPSRSASLTTCYGFQHRVSMTCPLIQIPLSAHLSLAFWQGRRSASSSAARFLWYTAGSSAVARSHWKP